MQPERTPAGSPGWHDVTAFQRDVVIAVANHDDPRPSGARVKDRLDARYGEDIVRSRLYQALDALCEAGLLEKDRGTTDARTNSYALTETARRLVARQARRCVLAAGIPAGGPDRVTPLSGADEW